MKLNTRMEVLFLPSNPVCIKIFIYGFLSDGAWGRVYASVNSTHSCRERIQSQKNNYPIINKITQLFITQKKDLMEC